MVGARLACQESKLECQRVDALGSSAKTLMDSSCCLSTHVSSPLRWDPAESHPHSGSEGTIWSQPSSNLHHLGFARYATSQQAPTQHLLHQKLWKVGPIFWESDARSVIESQCPTASCPVPQSWGSSSLPWQPAQSHTFGVSFVS